MDTFVDLWKQRNVTSNFIGIDDCCVLGTLQEMYFHNRLADTHKAAFFLREYAESRSNFVRALQVNLMEREYFTL